MVTQQGRMRARRHYATLFIEHEHDTAPANPKGLTIARSSRSPPMDFTGYRQISFS